MAVNSEEMAADALSTTSKLSFDGDDVEVKNTTNGANSEENKALTKAATHQALLDVNKELGIKTEEKKFEVGVPLKLSDYVTQFDRGNIIRNVFK